MNFKIGCQTYTWEMLGNEWEGSLDDILDIISSTGFEGVEISNNMIGHYYDKPEELKKALYSTNLQFAAFAYSSHYGFSNPAYWNEEIDGVKRAINFLKSFPDTILSLGGASTSESTARKEKLTNACRFYNEAGRLGKENRVRVAVHPHSHHGSLIETEEDYRELMSSTDSRYLEWNPDTGHIVRGGQDLIRCLNEYKSRITHVHFKDVGIDGKWAPLGKGTCDFSGVLKILEEINYSGWIILEEESDLARENPKEFLAQDFKVIQDLIGKENLNGK